MAVNSSGIRDPARVLKISSTTLIEELKKTRHLQQVNQPVLEQMETRKEPVLVVRVEEAEMAQMWSFVQSKKQQRWRWSAIDHRPGQMLAYVLAPDQDAALVLFKQLLAPFGLTHFYTDGWGAYLRLLDQKCHPVRHCKHPAILSENI